MDQTGFGEKEIIARSLACDRDALEELLILRYEWLKSVASKTIPSSFALKVPSEEVVQEAFVKILKSFDAFHPESESGLFAWLKVIVQNTAKDMIRKAGVSKVVSQAEYAAAQCDESVAEFVASLAIANDPRASVVARHSELTHAFQTALRDLDPRQRRVIELLYFQNCSVEQAATAMGTTTDAVRGLRQRARQQIKDAIVRMSHFV